MAWTLRTKMSSGFPGNLYNNYVNGCAESNRSSTPRHLRRLRKKIKGVKNKLLQLFVIGLKIMEL